MTMTQPQATRARTRTRTSTRRGAPARTSPRRQAQRDRPTAAQKAYARRAQRTAAVDHGSAPEGVLTLARLRMPRSRASFVLLMMSLLATGVVLTLWLSTQAIADSYQLERVRAETAQLSERAERLQREVAREQTVSALDDKARGLGMVPSGHPARILVTDSGKKKLIGEPQQAQPKRQVAGDLPPSESQPDAQVDGDLPGEQGQNDGESAHERESGERQVDGDLPDENDDQGEDER